MKRLWYWLFGYPGRYSWCLNCCRPRRPGIFERLGDWVMIRVIKVHSINLLPSTRPGRIIYIDEFCDAVNTIKTVDVSHNPPLDPVYHGPTRGEPVPTCYARSPVMIPAREPIIPKAETSQADFEEKIMTHPSVYNPWFVVFRQPETGPREYYVADVEIPVVDPEASVLRPIIGFTQKPHEAMVFLNLNNAARVARVENAEILVLASKDDLRRYRA
jgi:hypothetical protein